MWSQPSSNRAGILYYTPTRLCSDRLLHSSMAALTGYGNTSLRNLLASRDREEAFSTGRGKDWTCPILEEISDIILCSWAIRAEISSSLAVGVVLL
jgi:hypothetical protein